MAQLWGGRFTKETDNLYITSMHPSLLTRNSMSRTSEAAKHT